MAGAFTQEASDSPEDDGRNLVAPNGFDGARQTFTGIEEMAAGLATSLMLMHRIQIAEKTHRAIQPLNIIYKTKGSKPDFRDLEISKEIETNWQLPNLVYQPHEAIGFLLSCRGVLTPLRELYRKTNLSSATSALINQPKPTYDAWNWEWNSNLESREPLSHRMMGSKKHLFRVVDNPGYWLSEDEAWQTWFKWPCGLCGVGKSMLALKHALDPQNWENQTSPVMALTGLGGVGKSMLALKHALDPQNWEGLLYVLILGICESQISSDMLTGLCGAGKRHVLDLLTWQICESQTSSVILTGLCKAEKSMLALKHALDLLRLCGTSGGHFHFADDQQMWSESDWIELMRDLRKEMHLFCKSDLQFLSFRHSGLDALRIKACLQSWYWVDLSPQRPPSINVMVDGIDEWHFLKDWQMNNTEDTADGRVELGKIALEGSDDYFSAIYAALSLEEALPNRSDAAFNMIYEGKEIQSNGDALDNAVEAASPSHGPLPYMKDAVLVLSWEITNDTAANKVEYIQILWEEMPAHQCSQNLFKNEKIYEYRNLFGISAKFLPFAFVSSLKRRIGSLHHPSVLTRFAPLLFIRSASAASNLGSPAHEEPATPSSEQTWLQVLLSAQRLLIPSTRSPRAHETDPATLLLAVFIGTSAIALFARFGRRDMYQPHIITSCAAAAVACGAVTRCGVQQLVFVWLLWGCVSGVVGSKVVHTVLGLGEKAQIKEKEAILGEMDDRKDRAGTEKSSD